MTKPRNAAGLRAAAALAGALAAVAACSGGGPFGGRASAATAAPNVFAANALWDDGRAEIDAYQASTRRYGVPRLMTAYLIVVKEDFSRSEERRVGKECRSR